MACCATSWCFCCEADNLTEVLISPSAYFPLLSHCCVIVNCYQVQYFCTLYIVPRMFKPRYKLLWQHHGVEKLRSCVWLVQMMQTQKYRWLICTKLERDQTWMHAKNKDHAYVKIRTISSLNESIKSLSKVNSSCETILTHFGGGLHNQ